MSYFNDLFYVTDTGIAAPVDPNHPDNPYFGNTMLAKEVLVSDMRKIQWRCSSGKDITLRFQSSTIAALDPKSGLLIVVVHFSDPQFRRPANAVAITSRGTVDHVITPPLFLERVIEKMPGAPPLTRRFPVEAIAEVLLKQERILIGLNFNYDWIERRYYDASSRTWQETDETYRK